MTLRSFIKPSRVLVPSISGGVRRLSGSMSVILWRTRSISRAPWQPDPEVDSDDKRRARLNCISHLLSMVPYEEIEYPAIALPPTNHDPRYQRPPKDSLNWIPEVY